MPRNPTELLRHLRFVTGMTILTVVFVAVQTLLFAEEAWGGRPRLRAVR